MRTWIETHVIGLKASEGKRTISLSYRDFQADEMGGECFRRFYQLHFFIKKAFPRNKKITTAEKPYNFH